MEFKDYYETLGVPPGADADVIKSAYRRLARKFHPDVSKEKNAEERFKAVSEAYEVLHDPKKRAAYDQLRAGGYRPGQEFRPPPNFSQDFDFDVNDLGEGGFSDFFESLFGRMRGGAQAPRGRRARRPRDLHARLEIDLERAFQGGPERLQVDGRTLEVKIPAGVQPGQQIRLAGQGHDGGSLLLEVQYRPHARFTVEGRNVLLRLPIAPWEAALGTTVTVPTLAGSVELRVPPNSDSGRKLRLKGRGLPGPQAGDQYVILEVHAPEAGGEHERAAYEQFAQAFRGFNPRQGF